jgi:deoxyadenosine/deoxycytidine kinase
MPVKKAMSYNIPQEIKNYRSENSTRIEVCGGIASGKTTLASLMQRAEYDAVLEDFQSNPFIENFYTDPKLYAFETEISFLLQHYSQIKTAIRSSRILICDYSFYLDLSYARVTLNSPHISAFNSVYDAAFREVGPPTLLVHLLCSAETEMKRIRYRQRPMENSISIEYLEVLNNVLRDCVALARQYIKVIEVNSDELDFAHDPCVQDEVVKLIAASLPDAVAF